MTKPNKELLEVIGSMFCGSTVTAENMIEGCFIAIPANTKNRQTGQHTEHGQQSIFHKRGSKAIYVGEHTPDAEWFEEAKTALKEEEADEAIPNEEVAYHHEETHVTENQPHPCRPE